MSYTVSSTEMCNEIRHPNLLFDNIIWDPRSVETGSHQKRRNSTIITACTDRRGYALWVLSLVWTCQKNRCEQRHPQSDGPGNTGYQTTRTSQENMAPTDEGRHDERGCYPGYGPEPRVEKRDKADP